jgi:hypothetical protein
MLYCIIIRSPILWWFQLNSFLRNQGTRQHCASDGASLLSSTTVLPISGVPSTIDCHNVISILNYACLVFLLRVKPKYILYNTCAAAVLVHVSPPWNRHDEEASRLDLRSCDKQAKAVSKCANFSKNSTYLVWKIARILLPVVDKNNYLSKQFYLYFTKEKL